LIDKDVVTKYLGVPYKHQGRDMRGLDCYGIIICAYADIGIKLFDIEEDYSEDWSWKGKNYFIENYYKQWEKVIAPKFMDVVLFKNSKGAINHAGIMLDENRFIHTSKVGTVVSRIADMKEHRLEGYYRYKL
jgi:cell wall-associated NlpC family hydrolase